MVKSGDKRSKVGEHFKKIGNGLTETNDKLKELSGKLSESKNIDGIAIEAVKGAIKGASDVFEKLVGALTKLAGVTNDGADIGDTANNSTSVPAEEASVKTIIAEVKNIIDAAEKSGVEIDFGIAGEQVTNANGSKALIHNAGADANVGPKLAAEVSKADPWAMIDKIRNAKTSIGAPAANNDHEAGVLATGAATANGAGAKTNADLAAAVALKAMTKGGKLSAAADEFVGVKAAGVSAVNKVLGVLELVIRKTVSKSLDKVREAVKEIKYSDTSGINAPEAGITQVPVTK